MRPLLPIGTAALLALAACSDYGLTTQPPPEAPDVAIAPADPLTADALVAEILERDPRVRYGFQWFRDGQRAAEFTTDTVPNAATRKGELWQVLVTPYLGELAGGEARDQVEIGNTPPTVSLAWEQPAPSTLDDLAVVSTPTDPDEDPVTLRYAWSVDGETVQHEGPRLPFDRTSRGQTWTVEVTPDDGEGEGPTASLSVTIRNLAPELDLVVVEPDPAFTDTTLRARPIGLDDLDGDEIALTFDWFVDGLLVASGPDDTLDGSYFVKHQRVHVDVTPTDGADDGATVSSAEIAILNSPPAIDRVDLEPTPIRTRTDATCAPVGWADADGDPEGYRFAWTVNGAAAGAAATLPHTAQRRGDVLVCEVTPLDGEDAGAPRRSASVTVANTPPAITGVTLSPSSPKVADTLSVAVTGASDDDGDAVSFRYAWTVNSATIGHTGSTLTSAFFKKGDRVAVTVTPHDGIDDGAPLTSATVTVANTAPVVTALTLAPRPAYKSTPVTATPTASDADGDTLAYVYAWYVNGAKHSTTGSTLATSAFKKRDTLYAEVTATDGSDSSTAFASATLTISNSAPSTPPTPGLTPTAPTPTDSLVCAIGSASTDADSDALTYEFEYWRNSARYASYSTTALSHTLASSATADRDTWYCRVRANDGDGGVSAWSANSAVRTVTAPGGACTTVEGWDTGAWGSGWSSRSTGSISTSYAHDGSHGIRDPEWSYNTGSTFTTGYAGEKLKAWVRGGSGRIYLGFDASSSGAKSFVVAYNTADIRFQNNSGYGYTELTTTSMSHTAGRWYLMEVEFASTSATGRLYDSDGTTLRGSVTHSYGESLVGGIAVRAFSSGDIDTVQICR
jgi:hypothetical protein